MDGRLRLAGSRLRLAVQLVDSVTGAHLWAENYERAFNTEVVFELQDDLVPRVVLTVADMYGILPRSMSAVVRDKDPANLTPYEAFVRSFIYNERLTPEEHASARDCLELAVRRAPRHAEAWAMLSWVYCDEYAVGFNARPDSLDRGLDAARRAHDADPASHTANFALAYAHFFRKEFSAFKNAAERTLALNPLDAFLGMPLAYSGEWERGCALVERALQLNPNCPGKYWYPIAVNAYRKGDYRAALDFALKTNTPGVIYDPLLTAAAHAQLGDRASADRSLRELLRLIPDYAQIARQDLGKWFDPNLVEHYIDGLRLADWTYRRSIPERAGFD
jgi:tetratricopeptide (TPR) repeat protein